MLILCLKRLPILLTVLVGPLFYLGCYNLNEEDKVQKLSQKYCITLSHIETNDEADEDVLKQMMLAASDLGEENKELTQELKQDIANRIKSTDNRRIAYVFATEFVSDLLKTCPTYSKLVRLQLPKAEKKNKTITYVSDRVKGFMKEWEHLALPEIYDRATDSIVTNLGYAGSSYSDYGTIDPYVQEPINDIHIQLLYTSDVYFKSFLANEQLRAMGVAAKNFPVGVQRKWNFSEIE